MEYINDDVKNKQLLNELHKLLPDGDYNDANLFINICVMQTILIINGICTYEEIQKLKNKLLEDKLKELKE